MTLDKKEHKQFLLEMMQQVQYPGHVLELAYEVMQAVKNAAIEQEIPNAHPSA